jgi:uncharacterized repeat protein (TIGR03803 family)
VQGSDGNFYGMTEGGGNYDSGTIFKITATGTFTVLRHLDGLGGSPEAIWCRVAMEISTA